VSAFQRERAFGDHMNPSASRSGKQLTVVCVIPAYNEERFVANVIAAIPGFVRAVVVVNDASTDGTAEAVREINDPRVTLLNHRRNRGVGGAMVTGYRKAVELGADVVVKIDADGQMDPSEIGKLIAPIRKGLADYAKGVRFRDAGVLRRMPRLRLIGNLALSFLTKVASGYWNVFDPTNGFTAIARQALAALDLDALSARYFFESSMLIHLYRIGAVVQDVPIKAVYGREVSDLRVAGALVTFPVYLLQALGRRVVRKYLIEDFSALSVFLISGLALGGFGTIFGLYKWIGNWVKGVATPAGTVMLAAFPCLLGFQLLLQAIVLDIGNVPRIPLQDGFTDEPDNE